MTDPRYRVAHYVGMGPVLGEPVARAGKTGRRLADPDGKLEREHFTRKPYA